MVSGKLDNSRHSSEMGDPVLQVLSGDGAVLDIEFLLNDVGVAARQGIEARGPSL